MVKASKNKRAIELYPQAVEAMHRDIDHWLGNRAPAVDFTPIEEIALIGLVSTKALGMAYGGYVETLPQVQVGRYRVDFMVRFFDEKFIVECDGHDFHERTKQQAQHDKQRDRFLQAEGFKVFRFTGSEIWSGLEWVDEIRAEITAIARRRMGLK